jgi:hypothetical protein
MYIFQQKKIKKKLPCIFQLKIIKINIIPCIFWTALGMCENYNIGCLSFVSLFSAWNLLCFCVCGGVGWGGGN